MPTVTKTLTPDPQEDWVETTVVSKAKAPEDPLGDPGKAAAVSCRLSRNSGYMPRPRPTFDLIRLVSNVPKPRLSQLLPLKRLRQDCHSFRVLNPGVLPAWSQSAVEFVLPSSQAPAFWLTLLNHQFMLGHYDITKIELAYDFLCPDVATAQGTRDELLTSIRKKRHARGMIKFAGDHTTPPPSGYIAGPTYYYEDAKARTPLKLYCRYAKLPCKTFDHDQPLARVEWTVKGSDAIRRLGIHRLADLQKFTGWVSFFDRHASFEKLDYKAFGAFIDPKSSQPEATARQFLTHKARTDPQFAVDTTATALKWHSPSQIRGYLRKERARACKKNGRPNAWEAKLRKLSYYKLGRLFVNLHNIV